MAQNLAICVGLASQCVEIDDAYPKEEDNLHAGGTISALFRIPHVESVITPKIAVSISHRTRCCGGRGRELAEQLRLPMKPFLSVTRTGEALVGMANARDLANWTSCHSINEMGIAVRRDAPLPDSTTRVNSRRMYLGERHKVVNHCSGVLYPRGHQ